MKWNWFRFGALAAGGVILVTLLGAYALACGYVYLVPSLPSLDAMRNVELQVPLRVYTRTGKLIAQIGEQRRIPVTYDQIPELVKHAFLAAEDERFFEHHGIDYFGVVRAALIDVISGEKTQGASTITMQAARNMFLTLDKTARRKLQETFVTYRMEHEFTKQEIFGLYLNVIFFGQRSYGVAAAAEAFFGKTLDKLDVAEAATIAGVPKAPSRFNPIVDAQAATQRRAYVLRRMRELGYIDAATAEAANKEPMQARAHAPLFDVEAPYVAEMARLELRQRFGPAAETAGYKVYTTIDGRLQTAANRAVRVGLIEYDRRHGWRGPAGHVDLPAHGEPDYDDLVDEYAGIGNLAPAVVTAVDDRTVKAYVKSLGPVEIEWDGLSWARKELRNETLGPAPKDASQVLARGDVVYVVADDKGARAARPDPRGAERAGGARPERRQHRGAGRRLRLLHQQVQPRHPGAAPAGLGIQAVPVLGGARERPDAGDRAARCPDRARGQRQRGLLAAGEFHQGVRRPDAAARGAGALAQPGLDPRAQGDRHPDRHRLHQPLRLRSQEHAARPDARPRHAGGHAARRRQRLRGVRQRRLPRRAVLHRPHRGRRRAGGVAGRTAHGVPAVRRRPAGRAGAAERRAGAGVRAGARGCRPASTASPRRCPPRRWRRGSSARRTPIS